MKKEMLRVHNLYTDPEEIAKLIDVSLRLMAGECVGLLGLVHSGKSVLVDILQGKETRYKGSIYVNEKRILNLGELDKLVYVITGSNYIIDDWTAAEYIGLVEAKSWFGFTDKKAMTDQARKLFDEIGINISPTAKMKELSELEKRMVDLAKAYARSIKIIIVEDEFEGCTAEDIQRFKYIMDKTRSETRLMLVNSNSNNVQSILADRCVIFKKGYIVKKCKKEYIQNSAQIEKFMLGSRAILKKEGLDSYPRTPKAGQEVVMSVRNVILSSGEQYQFDFLKGEVYTLLELDMKKKEEIFYLLSGRVQDRYQEVYIDGNKCDYKNVMEYVDQKIVSIAHMGDSDELLLSMSPGENLLIPSLRKISTWEYIISAHKINSMLEKEMGILDEDSKRTIKSLTINDCIGLVLERWYVYKPKVLILFEPFVNCDVYGVSLVKSYIKKFVGIGTTVIIVKSREEYIEDISDRIIEIK